MGWVASLDDPQALSVEVAGGKAATLARLRAAGHPVPAGFAVPADAFPVVPPDVQGELESCDPISDPERLRKAAADAREAVRATELPAGLAAAVGEALTTLGSRAVAVRSSGVAEDLGAASFAGQYESFLNVTGEAGVLAAIVDVWASAYSERAVVYRRLQDVPERVVRMAVLVGEMLEPSASGVLFTCDPLTGDESRMTVEAALGLGEGVVAGSVPGDRFILDAASGAVTSRGVRRKDVRIAAAPGGGVTRVPVPPFEQAAPALGEAALTELWEAGCRVRELLGPRQDLEFCVAGRVHLLQARPVTTPEAAPELPVPDDGHTWVYAGRGPETRLQQDLAVRHAEAMRVCFEETGAPMAQNHIVRFVEGFRYVRAPEVDEDEVARRREAHARHARRYEEQGTTYYDAEIRPQVEARLAELRAFRSRGRDLGELVAHLERALDTVGRVMGDLHWRMASAMGGGGNPERQLAAGTDLAGRYHEITGEPEAEATVLLQAVPNATTRLVRRLRRLARIVQDDPELRAIFASRDYDRLPSAGPEAQRLRRGLRGLLRDYGLRTGQGFGSSAGSMAPTWRMRPELPFDLIGAYARQDLDALDALERRARRERDAAVRRVRRLLRDDPGGLADFEEEYRRARDTVRRMEDHNHLMDQFTTGALREAIHVLGERLVADDVLDDPDDVLHLAMSELQSLAAGSLGAAPRRLVAERGERQRMLRGLRPPRRIGGDAPARGEEPRAPDEDDGALVRGTPASRGRGTGRVRVALPGPDPPDVERGDILVARNAGPDWTPIFPLLGGLVLDAGAVFQHAALVAREYGIPAVLMTTSATSVLRDGQIVTVDGSAGTVREAPG